MKQLIHYTFIFAIMALLAACSDDPKKPGYEYMPDMYRSASYETNSANPLLKDSMTEQSPVEGTIARGDALYSDIDRMPYPYPNTNEGYEQAGKELHNPLPHTDENMAEGKRLYENYCIHCHGEKGQGDGPVVQRNGPKPPAYNSDALKDLPEGKAFHTTEYGKNMMGSHASQLLASQRWKIIMYVQTLQKQGAPNVAGATVKDSIPKQTVNKKG